MTRPRRIVPFVLLTAFASSAGASPNTKPHEPPPDEKVPKKLLDLRADLLHQKLDEAKKHTAKFRPLCDADGYPLVGNVMNKGDNLQPSEWCASVRASDKK